MVSKVAVFIDAENMNADMALQIFQKAALLGTIVERRAYGDFTENRLHEWIKIAPKHLIEPRFVLQPVPKKNSSDIAMTIDVIEMLCRDDVDVFCLVTSDSDFARVARHILRRGKKAIGLGEAKTSPILRDAFDQFFEVGRVVNQPKPLTAKIQMPENSIVVQRIQKILSSANHPVDDWFSLGMLGKEIDYRNYGSASLSKFLKKYDCFEWKPDSNNHARIKNMNVVSIHAKSG